MTSSKLLPSFCLALAGLGLANCGGSGGSNEGVTFQGFNTGATLFATKDGPRALTGATEFWTAALTGNTDGTFTFTSSATAGGTAARTITGTFLTVGAGFLKFTVTGCTGTGCPSNGANAYGLNIPGFALLVQPDSNGAELIPMIAGGSCPTNDLDLNWVQVQSDQDSNSTSADFFGTFHYAFASLTPNLPSKFALESYTDLSGTGGGVAAGTGCTNGILNVSSADIFLNTQGGALVHSDGGGGGAIVAMPQSSISASGLAGDYVGLAFTDGGSGGETQPFAGTMSSGGVFSGAKLTDETGTLSTTDTATVTMDAFNSPSTGFAKAHMVVTSSEVGFGVGGSTSALTLNTACEAAQNVLGSGKNFMFCVAQGFTANGTSKTNGKAVSLLFVSK